MLERARAALPELPAARAERFERELGLTADTRAAAGVARRAGRLLRGRRSRATATSPSRWPTGSTSSWRASTARTRQVEGAPGALATLVGLVSDQGGHPGRAKEVLDRLVAEGGEPAAIVEG